MRMVSLSVVAAVATSLLAQEPAARRATGPSQVCGTEGTTQLLCGPSRSEDLLAIPNTDWIVASSLAGGIHLIDARERTSVQLYPSPTARERLDRTAYPTCLAAPDDAEKRSFTTLGLALRPGLQGVHTLYAVRYPSVSRVHVFELDLRAVQPSVTWIGCVEAPERILLNSLVALPDGGLLATHFYERGPDPAAARARAVVGEITGKLLRWEARQGWSDVAGSDASGPNGVALSPDAEWAYVSEWGRSSFFRMRLSGQPRREAVRLEFRPDNVHWTPDGMLLVGGATDTDSRVVTIDPDTLDVTELVRLPDTARFFHASVAARIADELWLGSARADRIAIHPLRPR